MCIFNITFWFVLCTVLDDDTFIMKLVKKTSCTADQIQELGLKLLGSDVAVSHCNDPNLPMKIYKIYMEWREQMRKQRKTPSEMVELLRCALSETWNAAALKFLDFSLDPFSLPPQETRKSVNGSVFYCLSNFCFT